MKSSILIGALSLCLSLTCDGPADAYEVERQLTIDHCSVSSAFISAPPQFPIVLAVANPGGMSGTLASDALHIAGMGGAETGQHLEFHLGTLAPGDYRLDYLCDGEDHPIIVRVLRRPR